MRHRVRILQHGDRSDPLDVDCGLRRRASRSGRSSVPCA